MIFCIYSLNSLIEDHYCKKYKYQVIIDKFYNLCNQSNNRQCLMQCLKDKIPNIDFYKILRNLNSNSKMYNILLQNHMFGTLNHSFHIYSFPVFQKFHFHMNLHIIHLKDIHNQVFHIQCTYFSLLIHTQHMFHCSLYIRNFRLLYLNHIY